MHTKPIRPKKKGLFKRTWYKALMPNLSIILLFLLVLQPIVVKQNNDVSIEPYANNPSDGIPVNVAAQSAEEVIEDAMYVYSYFVLFPFELEQKRVDGLAKVKDNRLNTYQKLHQYCRQTFSDAICKQLMSNGKYVEKQGYLYATGNGRPKRNDIISTSYQLIEQSDDRMVYDVQVVYQNNQGKNEATILTFVRIREGSRWVFAEFPFYW